MFAKTILILHKLQYPIPGFFTFGLWITTFFSWLMGNSTIAWYLLYFLMLKIFVQLSFIYVVIKKMAAQEDPESLKKYTAHTRMNLAQNGMSGIGSMSSFQEMVQKQAESMQQKTKQSNPNADNQQTISIQKKNDDYIEYEEIEDENIFNDLKVGDVICINQGTSDPDFPELDLSGYHARIKKLYQENGLSLVSFVWDSISIETMPLKYFRMANENGLNFFEMILEVTEVSKATARDTVQDVEKMRNRMTRLINDDE